LWETPWPTSEKFSTAFMNEEPQLGMQAVPSYATPNHVGQPFVRICNRASFYKVGTKDFSEMVRLDGKQKIPFTAEVVIETTFCQPRSGTDVAGRRVAITLLKKNLPGRARRC
jgi:hypothetical protein